MKRRNVVGRANVEDTPELEEYYRALEGEELGALWNVANEIEPVPTTEVGADHLEVAARRTRSPRAGSLRCCRAARGDAGEPGRKEWSAAVGLLHRRSGDESRRVHAHRHQASALRFVMEGRGAYTVADGERLEPGARDFVPHAERHLARPRRFRGRHPMHLAGRARHSDEFARREFLRSASEDRADACCAFTRQLVRSPTPPSFSTNGTTPTIQSRKTASTNIPIRSRAAR